MRKLDKFNKMIAMGAFCVGAAATLVGCGGTDKPGNTDVNNYNPEDEDPEEVYGPPEMFNDSDYEPEGEEPATIYGPPEMMEEYEKSDSETSEDSTTETTADKTTESETTESLTTFATTEYSPTEEFVVTLYGPAEP